MVTATDPSDDPARGPHRRGPGVVTGSGSAPSTAAGGLVVLLGLMASGKSTVGAAVAARTGRSFVDVDAVVRTRTGLTTRQLWERAGEVGYRPLERDISVHVLSEGGPVVLALPGGAIEDPLVREALASATPTAVWLRARPATLAGRVGSSDHRPLVDDDPETLLARQQDRRGPIFQDAADLVIDVDELTADEVADQIVAALEP